MSNKIFIILFLFAVIISTFINHKVYDNSDTSQSNIEIMESIHSEYQKQRFSKGMAKYMYDRIKYYQEFDNWWERQYAVFKIYEALQNMNLEKE